jgi:hypothetical protein
VKSLADGLAVGKLLAKGISALIGLDDSIDLLDTS